MFTIQILYILDLDYFSCSEITDIAKQFPLHGIENNLFPNSEIHGILKYKRISSLSILWYLQCSEKRQVEKCTSINLQM